MSKRQNIVVACLTVWTFLHLFFLVLGIQNGDKPYYEKQFYPFEYHWEVYVEDHSLSESYDITEFIVYVGAGWVAFFVYWLLSKPTPKEPQLP